MNHLRLNAGTVHTEGSGDAPEWQRLVQKDAHLRQTLNRWHSKEDLNPKGGPKVVRGRHRKIVGSSRHILADSKDVQESMGLAPPMLTPQTSGDFENKEKSDEPQPHHFVSKPSVSPKRMKNMTGLDVPSLNLKKQRSLRQPHERADLSSIVARSKSDQVNNRANAMGTRRSVAKRGLSVRRLPSSELDFSSGKEGMAPLPTSSFVSAASTANKLGNLDEEDPSVTTSPTVSKDSPTHEYGEMDGTPPVQRNTDFDRRSARGVSPPTNSVEGCPSSPRPNENLPYLASSPVGGGLSHPSLGKPKRRDSISPFGRKPLGVSDLLRNPMNEMSCLSPTLHVVSQHGRVELQTKTREELSNGQGVPRSKSEQVTSLSQRQGHHGPGSRQSFAQRGLSVRNLPGSRKGSRGISQSSHSSTSHHSRPTCPSRTTSFASISTSVVMKVDSPKAPEKRMLPLLEHNFPPSEMEETQSRLHATNARISKPCPHPKSISVPTGSPKLREINISVPLAPGSLDKSVPRAGPLSPHRSKESNRQGTSPKPEKTRKAPPLDLPPAVLSMPVHSAHSTSPKPHNAQQTDTRANRNKMDSRELAFNKSRRVSPKLRPTISPTGSTKSMRALLARSPSKTHNVTELSRSPVRSRPKSPVPSRSALRPTMSKRLLSMRSIVSVNTNVAVSDEVYPNKAKRPSAVAPTSMSRESSGGGEYAAKAVQRKSLMVRLGDSFRLAAGAVLEDDDITRTSAEDDESVIGETAQASKPKAVVKRQASRTFVRPPDIPDPEIIVQKQNERRSLLTRLSRREINDEKTECTSVSKGVTSPPVVRREQPREETKKDSYIPDYIYFRQFSCPEENPDDASVITEAFTLVCEEEYENDGFDGASGKSGQASNAGIRSKSPGKISAKSELLSVVDASGSILGDMESTRTETDDPDELVDSLLNTSPRPKVRIPRLKSLRTQSNLTKTVWNLEESDGSLYIDTPGHQSLEEALLEDGDAYFSQVVNQLEKAKARESSSSDESTSNRKKKSKKRTQRRVDSSERILIEL